MAASVIALDDYRPHLTIQDHQHVHVLPVALARDWATGTLPLPDPCILRRIIVEWLACAHAGCIEHAVRDLD